MNFMHHYEVAAILNLALCTGIGWLCIGQLNSFRCRENLYDRARYVLLLAGAMASGLQPLLFSTWPAWADVFMSFTVLFGMAVNAVRWHIKEQLEGLA